MKMFPDDAEKFSEYMYALVADLEGQDAGAKDRLGAILAWTTMVFSNSTEKSFKDGNKSALMDALYISLTNGRLPPPWALQALMEGTIADPKSWDDVFGRPKRIRFQELQRARDEGDRLHAEGYKKDDNSLFPALADRLSAAGGKRISAGKAKNLYYGLSVSELSLLRDRVWTGTLDVATKQQLGFVLDVLLGIGGGASKKRRGKFRRENNQTQVIVKT